MDILFILDQIQLLRIKTVVNRALPSLHGGSHKIKRTVLNSLIKKSKSVNSTFRLIQLIF